MAIVAVIGLVLLFADQRGLTGAYKEETQALRKYAREPGTRTPSEYYAKVQGRGPAKPKPSPELEGYCAELWRSYGSYDDCLRIVGQLRGASWWEPQPYSARP